MNRGESLRRKRRVKRRNGEDRWNGRIWSGENEYWTYKIGEGTIIHVK